ncbi:MAG: hypothetical protein J5986_09845, partial [Roseburia sp.]|nr:hypothetical protein [Roseburia sp.]
KDDIGGLRDGIHVCDQHLTLNSGKLPIFLAVNERELKNILEEKGLEDSEKIFRQEWEGTGRADEKRRIFKRVRTASVRHIGRRKSGCPGILPQLF